MPVSRVDCGVYVATARVQRALMRLSTRVRHTNPAYNLHIHTRAHKCWCSLLFSLLQVFFLSCSSSSFSPKEIVLTCCVLTWFRSGVFTPKNLPIYFVFVVKHCFIIVSIHYISISQYWEAFTSSGRKLQLCFFFFRFSLFLNKAPIYPNVRLA